MKFQGKGTLAVSEYQDQSLPFDLALLGGEFITRITSLHVCKVRLEYGCLFQHFLWW